jgi:hypothetical protein
MTRRFTHPRGANAPRGLGLSDDQVDDLADFIENGLYDPGFVQFDPKSPTKMFQLSPPDFLYSIYRPDLVAAGATTNRPAVDGRPMSGLAQDNDDALSRRDMGLEFLDVTGRVNVALIASSRATDDEGGHGNAEGTRDGDRHRRSGGEDRFVYRIANNGASPVDTHLLVIATGLASGVEMTNASGTTSTGNPYIRVFLPNGVLAPGQSIDVTLRFTRNGQSAPNVTLILLPACGATRSRRWVGNLCRVRSSGETVSSATASSASVVPKACGPHAGTIACSGFVAASAPTESRRSTAIDGTASRQPRS